MDKALPPTDLDEKGLLQRIRYYLLDLDGTVYLDETWIEGALPFLDALTRSGRKYIFLTNNSSKSALSYVEKLKRMGLVISCKDIVTSGDTAIAYIKKRYPGKRVCLMGNRALKEAFREAGIPLSRTRGEIAVTSFDTELTYKKLRDVCALIRAGAPYIATHPDINCPTKAGFVPDIGAMEACIAASTGRRPDVILGKPHRGIVGYAMEKLGAVKEETVMVGDRLYTDIAAGAENGIYSLLVLTGETKIEDLAGSPYRPDLIFTSVKTLTEALKQG